VLNDLQAESGEWESSPVFILTLEDLLLKSSVCQSDESSCFSDVGDISIFVLVHPDLVSPVFS